MEGKRKKEQKTADNWRETHFLVCNQTSFSSDFLTFPLWTLFFLLIGLYFSPNLQVI